MGNLIAVPLVIACYILINIAYFAVLEPAEIDSLGGEAIALVSCGTKVIMYM